MYAESAEIPRSGLAGAVTWTPFASNRSITPLQLDASANAPCTSTTVGKLWLVSSDMLLLSSLPPVGRRNSFERLVHTHTHTTEPQALTSRRQTKSTSSSFTCSASIPT